MRILGYQFLLAFYKDIHIPEKIPAWLLAKAAGNPHGFHGRKRKSLFDKARSGFDRAVGQIGRQTRIDASFCGG